MSSSLRPEDAATSTPGRPSSAGSQQQGSPSGLPPLTPGSIATQLSKMDFPAPTNLRLNLPRGAAGGAGAPTVSDSPFSPQSATSAGGAAADSGTGDISGPEPEAITEARRKHRSESVSEQLSTALAQMNLPQPERIFGPDEVEDADDASAAAGGASAAGPAGGSAQLGRRSSVKKHGVSADDWAKIKLDDEVPEAVKAPERMTHSRNASRVDAASLVKTPVIKEETVQEETSAAAAPSAAPAASSGSGAVAKEQKITPFDVEGGVDEDGRELAIDYEKLMKRFGAQPVLPEMLERFERVTGHRPHPLMRRGYFYSHRDFNAILDRFEKGQPFYLYTGRGPSSSSMHTGHLIPFMFTAWLQKVFQCPLVIQITDDEKYLLQRDLKKQAEMLKKIKGKKPIDLLRHYKQLAHENIKDIIACGFILEKTYIFQDLQAMGGAFYDNVVLMSKCITLNNARGVFGFGDSDNVGMYHFAAIQATPSFSNSFPNIFGQRDDIPCLIPCAIDQDPYFLLTRDIADRLGYKKPSLLHSKFLPALQGAGTKMSASKENTAIFMTDDAKKIHKKIRSHAFSGGGATQEEHKANGGNPDIDIAYQYLSFFEDDDEKMARLAKEYRAGTLSTVEMKDACIAKLQEVVAEFQKNREQVTDDLVSQFLDGSRKIDPRPAPRAATTASV